jgi:hypothetical protein
MTTNEKLIVFVNGEKFDLSSSSVNVSELIRDGGGIPGEYELQQRNGRNGPVTNTFTNPEQIIEVKDGDNFTTRFTGPINPS